MTGILDHRNITTEQSRKASLAFLTAQAVQDVVDVIYAIGRGDMTHKVITQGWEIAPEERKSSLRIVVRTTEGMLLEPVRDMLRVFYTVHSMRDVQGDYLVVLI